MKRIAMTTMLATFLAAALAALGGCGSGSSSTSGPAGTDRSKQITAVTDTEKGALCDWFVGMVGGYGATPTCADGYIEAPPTKDECVSTFPNCAVTVGQFEDCITKIVDAQEICTAAALDPVPTSAECMAVGQAGCFE